MAHIPVNANDGALKPQKKQKPARQSTKKASSISPEDLEKRKAEAKERADARREKALQRTRLSDDERSELELHESFQRGILREERWEASHKARMELCKFLGLACLIVTPHRLDATIGTASCQQYAILSVLLYRTLEKTMSAREWLKMENNCRKIIGAAALENPRKTLLPTSDCAAPVLTSEIKALVEYCDNVLSQAQSRYLQLALALWESSTLSLDEFGHSCRLRGTALLGKHEAELRSEFSCLAHNLYAAFIANLPESRDLESLYSKTTSQYFMEEERKYPIKCPSVFATFTINNHLAWSSDVIVAIGVTRVGMLRGSKLGDDEQADVDLSYQLAFCDVYYYRKGSSGFRRIESPTLEEKSEACLFVDCVGTSFIDESNDNEGMLSLNRSEFGQFFDKVDPAWLLTSWATGHPDHAKRADEIAPLQDIIDDVYPKHNRKLRRDQFSLEGLDFSLPFDQQANPKEILQFGFQQATDQQQTGDCYFNDITVPKDEAVPRTASQLYFHVVHVFASKGHLEEDRQRTIRERHAANPGIALGRYMFTTGTSGHSCRTSAEAATLQKSSQRLEKYTAEYPEHKIFCTMQKPTP